MIEKEINNFINKQKGILAITGGVNEGKSLYTLKTVIELLADDNYYPLTKQSNALSELAYLLSQEKFIYFFTDESLISIINKVSLLTNNNQKDTEKYLIKLNNYVKIFDITNYTYEDIMTICNDSRHKSLLIIDGQPKEPDYPNQVKPMASQARDLTNFCTWAQIQNIPVIITAQRRTNISNIPSTPMPISQGLNYSSSIIVNIKANQADLEKKTIRLSISKNRFKHPMNEEIVPLKIKKSKK